MLYRSGKSETPFQSKDLTITMNHLHGNSSTHVWVGGVLNGFMTVLLSQWLVSLPSARRVYACESSASCVSFFDCR